MHYGSTTGGTMLAAIAEDIAILVKIAAGLGALAVILRSWLWMAEITHALRRIVKLLPTMELLQKLEPLVEILTREFRSNGGSTLSDKVKIIEEASTSAAVKAEEAKVATEKQDKVLEHQDQVLGHLEKSMEEIKGTVNKLARQPEK